MSRDGYLPPGCTQRECDMAQPGYWDNDPCGFIPECVHCDDAGCPECCELQPVTLHDLEEIQAEMDYAIKTA